MLTDKRSASFTCYWGRGWDKKKKEKKIIETVFEYFMELVGAARSIEVEVKKPAHLKIDFN